MPRPESPLREDIALEVDARRELDQDQAVGVEFEQGAPGEVENPPAAPAGAGAAEGRVVDWLEEAGGVPLCAR